MDSSALLLFCWRRNWELMCSSIFCGWISNCPESRADSTCWHSAEICSERKVDNVIPGWCTGPWWRSRWIYSPEERLSTRSAAVIEQRLVWCVTSSELCVAFPWQQETHCAVMSANAGRMPPHVRRHHVFPNLISKARLLKWSNKL